MVDQPGSKANVLSRPLLAELSAALDQLENERGLSGLVCRSGKPGMFIAGADLKELGDGTIAGEAAVEFARAGQRLFSRLERLPFPTVCIIEGPALGGGMEFALSFDARVVVDHPKTQLGLPETKLGLIPGWGGSQRLPRLVGLEKGLEMMLTGQSVTARESADWVERMCLSEAALGEAGKVVEELHANAQWQRKRDARYGMMMRPEESVRTERILQSARERIAQVREKTALAQRTVVELMAKTVSMDLYAGLEEEARAFALVAGSVESKELIGEFFAARAKR